MRPAMCILRRTPAVLQASIGIASNNQRSLPSYSRECCWMGACHALGTSGFLFCSAALIAILPSYVYAVAGGHKDRYLTHIQRWSRVSV